MCVCDVEFDQEAREREKWMANYLYSAKEGGRAFPLLVFLTVFVLFDHRANTERHDNKIIKFYETFLNYESNEWSHDHIRHLKVF